jgi:iron only hydrogenase large subunit-like protein
MFVSQCPGWVCYAEKCHPQAIPYISTTKSPQQIFGHFFREIAFNMMGTSHENIVTVSTSYENIFT